MQQTAPLEIGLPVIDLNRMVAFYTGVFDCKEVRRAEIPAELSAMIGVAKNGYTNVWLQFPGGEIIKLVRPPEAPGKRAVPAYSGTQTGIAYFTLYCDDIAAAIATAEEQGATLVSERALAGSTEGVRLAFLADPEGNQFEFVEVVEG